MLNCSKVTHKLAAFVYNFATNDMPMLSNTTHAYTMCVCVHLRLINMFQVKYCLRLVHMYLTYGEQSISWLPKVCSHELLEASANQQVKSINVSVISMSRSVCELKKFKQVSSECVCSILILLLFGFTHSQLFALHAILRPKTLCE